MDCAGLRADIDQLTQELQDLEEGVGKIRNAEAHGKEFRDVARLTNFNSLDPILENYLKDFQKQNPESFPAITLGERIDVG